MDDTTMTVTVTVTSFPMIVGSMWQKLAFRLAPLFFFFLKKSQVRKFCYSLKIIVGRRRIEPCDLNREQHLMDADEGDCFHGAKISIAKHKHIKSDAGKLHV
jgi:hypothetical protein